MPTFRLYVCIYSLHMLVCLSVSLSVCLRAYIIKQMPKLHQIFDTNAYDRGRGHGLGPSIGKVGLGFFGVGFIDTVMGWVQ